MIKTNDKYMLPSKYGRYKPSQYQLKIYFNFKEVLITIIKKHNIPLLTTHDKTVDVVLRLIMLIKGMR